MTSASTAGTKGVARADREAQIVGVAGKLFGERGYDAVNPEDVAERLDVTKGSLYYCFAGNDEPADALMPALLPLYTQLDPETYGGAMLLGVDGVTLALTSTACSVSLRKRRSIAPHATVASRPTG